MKISEFVDKFTIDPIKDIEPHFKLTKEVDIDAHRHKGCFNCENTANQYMLKSSPWTGVQYCVVCQHLNVIYYQDRMGGAFTDTIRCYTETSDGESNAGKD